MSRIKDQQQTLYKDVWGRVEAYDRFSPGATHLPFFLQHASPPGTVLDAGCGNGAGAVALANAGFTVAMCDITITEKALMTGLLAHEVCLWDAGDMSCLPYLCHIANDAFVDEDKVDYTYCCDVLEHIPPEWTMLVIQNLLSITKKGLFLSIALVPDKFGLWVGEPLHRTVQPFVWWRDNLRELRSNVQARDLLQTGIFFVQP